MNDELDPLLLALFANSREHVEEAQFLQATLATLERRLRRRALLRVAAIIAALAIAAAFMPWVLDQTADLFGKLPNRPWIWLASMPLGLLLVYRNGLRWLR